jgi:hypothetical protein
MAGFCILAVGLQAPNLAASRAKSPIVSAGYLKYSRFWETTTGDRVRSALRGRRAGRIPVCLCGSEGEIGSPLGCTAARICQCDWFFITRFWRRKTGYFEATNRSKRIALPSRSRLSETLRFAPSSMIHDLTASTLARANPSLAESGTRRC